MMSPSVPFSPPPFPCGSRQSSGAAQVGLRLEVTILLASASGELGFQAQLQTSLSVSFPAHRTSVFSPPLLFPLSPVSLSLLQ